MKSTVFLTTAPLEENARAEWLERTVNTLARGMAHKFMIGQIEHRGDIGHVPLTKLLSHAEEEATDQHMYLAEIRRRLSNGHSYIMDADTRSRLGQALERLTHANQDIMRGNVDPAKVSLPHIQAYIVESMNFINMVISALNK